MIRSVFTVLFLVSCLGLSGLRAAEALPLLESSQLRNFEKLEEARQKIIEAAITTGRKVSGMPYKYGGNGPKDGGFDCSGAMHYIMQKVGLAPPRSSSGQFLWIKEHSQLHLISKAAKDTGHKSFSELKPGDLVFWSGTYVPTDGRKVMITHVGMFLGYEKRDGRPVMINATRGRSYRGKKGDGFGVYDFRVPKAGGKSRMIGYGTPPGLIKRQ